MVFLQVQQPNHVGLVINQICIIIIVIIIVFISLIMIYVVIHVFINNQLLTSRYYIDNII